MKRYPHRFNITGFLAIVIAALSIGVATGQDTGRFIIASRNAEDVSNADLRAIPVGVQAEEPYQSIDKPQLGVNLIARVMSRDEANALREDRPDLRIEEDRRLRPSGLPAVGGLPPWSPDRIDQRVGTDEFYLPAYLAQCGATRPSIYVCDTGIFTGHDEFTLAGARVQFTGSYIPALLNRTISAFEDPYDHGTAVAACAVGEDTGAGRCPANVISAVCYPDPGVGAGGTFASFAADVVYWSMNEHILRKLDNDPYNDASVLIFASSTLNGPSAILDLAVERARLEGMVVVVSAGNQNQSAAMTSPAGAYSQTHGDITLTVAASDIQDVRWSMSNYGARVELFGPGDNVLCASSEAPDLCTLRSGTSFSAGYVGGAAARILAHNPWATADCVFNLLTDQSDPDYGPSGPFGSGVDAVPKLLYVNPDSSPCVTLSYGEWVALFAPVPPDPEADGDGDGLVNLLEYFLGLNPTVCDPPANRPAMTITEDDLEFRFRRANFLCSDVSFQVEVSNDCLQWTALDPSLIADDPKKACIPEATWKLAVAPNDPNRMYVRLSIAQ